MRDVKLKVEFDLGVTLCYDSMYFAEMDDEDCCEIQESVDTGRCLSRERNMYNMIHDDDSKETFRQYLMDHINSPEFLKYINIRVTSMEDLDEEELKELYKDGDDIDEEV